MIPSRQVVRIRDTEGRGGGLNRCMKPLVSGGAMVCGGRGHPTGPGRAHCNNPTRGKYGQQSGGPAPLPCNLHQPNAPCNRGPSGAGGVREAGTGPGVVGVGEDAPGVLLEDGDEEGEEGGFGQHRRVRHLQPTPGAGL